VRILWHSNSPYDTTGYSIQTTLFVPRLAALGHEILIHAPYSMRGAPVAWSEYTVLPRSGERLGGAELALTAAHNEVDAVIALSDLWQLLPGANLLRDIPFAHWAPVDCIPLPRLDAEVLHASAASVLAMSQFGQRALEAAGVASTYIPHGVDTRVFRPRDSREAREALGFPHDSFVIGINAANRKDGRKGLPEQLCAFARFLECHKDAHLFIHAAASPPEGMNLRRLVDQLGIGASVRFPDEYAYETGGYSREWLACWYSALDVLSNCSLAEGFGLTPLEAQACGKPVIVSTGGPAQELCGAGWTVESEPVWKDARETWWHRCSVEGIFRAFEAAWATLREPGETRELAKRAREFALNFDADDVTRRFWRPAIDALVNATSESVSSPEV
jgi:glycosyltransferase involved in cell wall biosynthesis